MSASDERTTANPNMAPSAGTVQDILEGNPDVKLKRKVPGEVPAMGRMTHEAAAFEESLGKRPLADLRDLLARQGICSSVLKPQLCKCVTKSNVSILHLSMSLHVELSCSN